MQVSVGEPLIEVISFAYMANQPVLLEGVHGIGKSECLEDAAKRMKIGFCVLDLSLCEPPDLVGLPFRKRGRTHYAPPSSFPESGKGILAIEEIARAPSYMRAPCLQLLTARRLNDYVLPPGWLPCACCNPAPKPEDEEATQYEGEPLDPALRSRFLCVDVKADVGAWMAWARPDGVHEAVLSMVARAGLQAFTTHGGNPRSWVYASKQLRAFDGGSPTEDTVVACLVGILGAHWGLALSQAYLAFQRPLEPVEILEQWSQVEPIVDAWAAQGQSERIVACWESLRSHLRRNKTAQDVANDPEQVKSCRALIKRLPPRERREAAPWLGQHLAPFGLRPRGARGQRAEDPNDRP